MFANEHCAINWNPSMQNEGLAADPPKNGFNVIMENIC